MPSGVLSESACRALVFERSNGRCELCRQPATNFAHRVAKGQGGLWLPSNGLRLCGSGTTGCHGWCHANPRVARCGGWIVESWQDPAAVAVYLRPVGLYPGWWLIDDDGTFQWVDRHDVPVQPEWAYKAA